MDRTTGRSGCRVCIAIKSTGDRRVLQKQRSPPYSPEKKMPIIVALAIARRQCELTQDQLAELSDRSQQLIGKLEQGKCKGIGFETLENLCKVTNRQVGDIIVYIPDDPRLLDDTLVSLSRKWNCSISEILPYIPNDLKRAYRRSNRI